MIIEIHGTGAHNSGAELMAAAIRQWVVSRNGIARCAVSADYGSYAQRASAGLETTFSPHWLSRSGFASLLFNKRFLDTYGIVPAKQIDAVLDASGYAYGEKWGGPEKCELHELTRRWKSWGRKVILMPQSFGPFEHSGWKDLFRRAAEKIDLIFARDHTSLVALQQLDLQAELCQAPDFTVGVRGYVPTDCPVDANSALVVPNQRMIDKGDDRDRVGYVRFLVEATEALRRKGLNVLALVHSSGDSRVIEEWQSKLRHPISIIRETHPLVVKGLLSVPRVVIGSRYHALISAMLQGVPCLGTGWSHKYTHLFEDFGVPQLLLRTTANREEIETAIDMAVGESTRQQVMVALRNGLNRYLAEVDDMWQRIARCLEWN